MSASLRTHVLTAQSSRGVVLLATLALAVTGCGSSAGSKPASHLSSTATKQLALAPAPRSSPPGKPGGRPSSARNNATKPRPAASSPCAAGEKRTFTGLCFSPSAQTKLVKKLGPCLAGQVVADNGACQPLTSETNRPSLPARCRRVHRADCLPVGSLQGSHPVARGPGFDAVFH